MSKQGLGNALAGLVFLVIAIVDFVRDSSGIGFVFVIFAAVFLALASKRQEVGATRVALTYTAPQTRFAGGSGAVSARWPPRRRPDKKP